MSIKNIDLYEIVHLAKTGKVKIFSLRGYSQIFWYDQKKKIFCMAASPSSNSKIECKEDLIKYICSSLHQEIWYEYGEDMTHLITNGGITNGGIAIDWNSAGIVTGDGGTCTDSSHTSLESLEGD